MLRRIEERNDGEVGRREEEGETDRGREGGKEG